MSSLVAFIEAFPGYLTEYRQKLEDKVKRLLGSTPMDEENRIMINSDSHSAGAIAYAFDQAQKIAYECGFRKKQC